MGYQLKQNLKKTVTLAWKTWANHFNKLKQLYEQGGGENRIAKYVKHWLAWVKGGVDITLNEVIKEGLSSGLGRTLVRLYRVDLIYFS